MVLASFSLFAAYLAPIAQADSLDLTVTNTNDSGAGSLRAAITTANATATTADAPHHITFAISGSGVQTISLATVLPTITKPTIIDGSTQTGAQCGQLVKDGVDGMIQGNNTPHALTVQVTGCNMIMANSDVALIAFSSAASGSELRGLVINGNNSNAASGDYGFAVSTQAPNTKFDCNYFGVEPDGITPVAATSTRGVVRIFTAATGTAVTNNLIGRSAGGAYMTTSAPNIMISYNLVGVDKTGLARIATDDAVNQVGISYSGATNGEIYHNVVAGAGAADNGGIGSGWDDRSNGLKIRGNYVNVGNDGTTSLGWRNGVGTFNAVQIGGPDNSDRNIVNGLIRPNVSAGSLIENNYVGITKDGSRTIEPEIGNAIKNAIYLGYRNQVGTIIRGNTIGGVTIGIAGDQRTEADGSVWCSDVTIEDNWIGVTKTGATVANVDGIGWFMISFNCVNSIIRHNAIGGSAMDGMALGAMKNSQIYGNVIGGGIKDGVVIPQNKRDGIRLANANGTVIGKEGDGNIITNNAGDGIALSVANGSTSQIAYNTISGNTNGVRVSAGVSQVTNNTIVNNTNIGVYVANGAKATIQKNSIYGNTSAGITLQGYQNDENDADTGGGNDGQNAPMIVSYAGCVTSDAAGPIYMLRSKPNTAYTIDVYDSASANNLQGQTWKNQFTVTTDSSGRVKFNRPTASDGSAITNLSMTATDADGNTSPFSNSSALSFYNCSGYVNTYGPLVGSGVKYTPYYYFTGPNLQNGTIQVFDDSGVLHATTDLKTYFYNNQFETYVNDASFVDTLGDGTYTVRTSFTDPLTRANLSFDAPITLDKTAPVGVITNPSETTSTSPELSGTVDDSTAGIWICIDSTEYQEDDGNGGTWTYQNCDGGEYFADNNGDGTWTLPAGMISPGLTLGMHTIHIEFFDYQRNWSEANQNLTVKRADADAPTVHSVSTDANNQVTITGTYDAENSAAFSVTVHGKKYVLGTNAELTATGNNWSLYLSADVTKSMGGTYSVIAASTTRTGATVIDNTTDELTVVGLIQPSAGKNDNTTHSGNNGELAPTGDNAKFLYAAGALLITVGGCLAIGVIVKRWIRV